MFKEKRYYFNYKIILVCKLHNLKNSEVLQVSLIKNVYKYLKNRLKHWKYETLTKILSFTMNERNRASSKRHLEKNSENFLGSPSGTRFFRCFSRHWKQRRKQNES